MFELTNVSYSYSEGVPVLFDVSLRVDAGDSIALVGANGCGKTTLLRILNGLALPKRGEYRFDGTKIDKKTMSDVRFAKEFHRRVGFVFQNSDSQLFCGSVDDEIAFGPRQLELDEAECRRRVDDCLNLLEIEHLRTRAPYALSGGEKRKVAFACVLALNPDALVVDEPLAGLDVRTQESVVELLRSLSAARKTLIFATHNDALVDAVANRRVCLEEGKIVESVKI